MARSGPDESLMVSKSSGAAAKVVSEPLESVEVVSEVVGLNVDVVIVVVAGTFGMRAIVESVVVGFVDSAHVVVTPVVSGTSVVEGSVVGMEPTVSATVVAGESVLVGFSGSVGATSATVVVISMTVVDVSGSGTVETGGTYSVPERTNPVPVVLP